MPVEVTLGDWAQCLTGGPISTCTWAFASIWWVLALVLCASIAAVGARRVTTAVWTLRAAAVTPTLSRYLARWVGARSYSDDEFYRADGASESWVERRRAGIARLSRRFDARQ